MRHEHYTIFLNRFFFHFKSMSCRRCVWAWGYQNNDSNNSQRYNGEGPGNTGVREIFEVDEIVSLTHLVYLTKLISKVFEKVIFLSRNIRQFQNHSK